MHSEEWLIDGYNLLHSVSSRKSASLRETLLTQVADFASASGYQVRFVLDGVGSDDEFSSFRTKNFQVVYSQKTSADCYIERWLFENRGKVRQVVVTSDRAISRMARGGGGRVIDPSEFLNLLKEAKGDSKDILFKQNVKSHGFHRPFDDKLKEKGL